MLLLKRSARRRTSLLAASNAVQPSVLLLRRQQGRRAAELARLLLANVGAIAEDLAAGVVLDENRIRVRRLPLRPVD